MEIKNKVVLRFLDGRVVKGVTWDFTPGKKSFHLAHAENEHDVVQVATSDLKAIFFVRSFSGDPGYKAPQRMDAPPASPGRRLKVTFQDGEIIIGTTSAYTPGREGFFVVPVDKADNNERIYIFAHATRDIELLQPTAPRGVAPAHGSR